MARIIGIDFGLKRCGVAATDVLQIAVHPVATIERSDLLQYLSEYIAKEPVEKIVFGKPVHRDGNPTDLMPVIQKFASDFSVRHPQIRIDFHDESYTSVHATKILQATKRKKARRNKSNVDVVSAVLILQQYLNHIP